MAGLQPSLRGKVYYAVGSVGGQRIRKSLGTRDKQRAEELCAHLEAALWRRHTFGEEAVRTFEEAALSYMEAGGERKYLPPIIRRFKGHLLASIKPGEIREAARVLYPEAKGSTRNRHVIVPARAVINHGASLGWCQPIRVANFPTEKTRRTAVGRDWIDSFLRQADVDKLPHLAAAVLFTWQTGARASEVSRVLPEHVNLHERTILLERTKTEWRVCHISRELMLRLANLPTRDATSVRLFEQTRDCPPHEGSLPEGWHSFRLASPEWPPQLCDQCAGHGSYGEAGDGSWRVEIGSARPRNLCPCRRSGESDCRPL
jgi:integrase